MGACPRRAGLISRIREMRHNTIVILAGKWTQQLDGHATYTMLKINVHEGLF